MSLSSDHPILRPVQAFPVKISGKEMVGLTDPTRVSSETLVVSPTTFFLISLMDGTRSVRDLQEAYMRRFGELIYSSTLDEVIATLDQNYFLDSIRFRDHIRLLHDEFRTAERRPAVFAGKSYEADPERLQHQLETYFVGPEGPGLPESGSGTRPIKGLIAPHIDFGRGGTSYAYAYKTLGHTPSAEVYVILGTCHGPMKNPFSFTKKPFETPLGTVSVADDLVDAIAHQLPFDPFDDEYCHRNEHTVEFQTIFLRYVMGAKKFLIVPILCGSFQEYVRSGTRPSADAAYATTVRVLRESLTDAANICVVASVDLAHIGPQFGDSEPVTPAVLAHTERQDRQMLGYVQSLNADAFYQFVLGEQDRRNICGLSAIHTFLETIASDGGELLHYQQWRDPEGTAAVTFASMAFF